MKKIFIFFVSALVATSLFGSIAGSAHDFSATGWTGGEICVACHTPHNAMAIADAPLWNHEVTAATFTVYTSSSLNVTLGQPDGVSKLCLSCHDGTVALDSFGGVTGTTFIAASGDVGTDLSNDHPISFSYQASITGGDTELFATTTATSLGGTIATDLLYGGNVECSSCHDVHNKYPANPSLLLISNAGSALCLTCHDK